MKRKKFTLLELIVVIGILGLLISIININIKDMNTKAKLVAFQTDKDTLQTAVNLYKENTNMLPIEEKKKEILPGLPERIIIDDLYTDYLRKKLKYANVRYWVDYNEKVYMSFAEAPLNISVQPEGINYKITWDAHENSAFYIIYSFNTSGDRTKTKVLGKTISTNFLVDKPESENLFYGISAVDIYRNETAAVGTSYTGIEDIPEDESDATLDDIIIPVDEGSLMTGETGNYYGDAIFYDIILDGNTGIAVGQKDDDGYVYKFTIPEENAQNVNQVLAALNVNNSYKIWDYVVPGKPLTDIFKSDNGYTVFSKGNYSSYLLKLNENGNEIWNTSCNGRNLNITETSDGYILTGSNENAAFLTKYSKNGEQLWETKRTNGREACDDAELKIGYGYSGRIKEEYLKIINLGNDTLLIGNQSGLNKNTFLEIIDNTTSKTKKREEIENLQLKKIIEDEEDDAVYLIGTLDYDNLIIKINKSILKDNSFNDSIIWTRNYEKKIIENITPKDNELIVLIHSLSDSIIQKLNKLTGESNNWKLIYKNGVVKNISSTDTGILIVGTKIDVPESELGKGTLKGKIPLYVIENGVTYKTGAVDEDIYNIVESDKTIEEKGIEITGMICWEDCHIELSEDLMTLKIYGSTENSHERIPPFFPTFGTILNIKNSVLEENNETDETNLISPNFIKHENVVINNKPLIATSAKNTLLVTNENRMFGAGSNKYGQLGRSSSLGHDGPGYEIEDLTEINIPTDSLIVSIASGGNASYVVTETGKVYTFGLNYYGQIGVDETFRTSDPQITPTDISSKFGTNKVVKVKASESNAYFITQNGDLYGLGDNRSERIKENPNNDSSLYYINDPIKIEIDNKDVKEIVPHGNSLTILTTDNKIYAIGNDSYLLYTSVPNNSYVNGEIDYSDQLLENEIIVDIAGGTHLVLLTNLGNIYTLGYNCEHQLGTNISDKTHEFQNITSKLEGKEVVDIKDARYATIIMLDDGTALYIGSNEYGALSSEYILNDKLNGRKIIDVSSNYAHTVVVTEYNQVYSLGYNYYGQLGNGKDRDVRRRNPNFFYLGNL